MQDTLPSTEPGTLDSPGQHCLSRVPLFLPLFNFREALLGSMALIMEWVVVTIRTLDLPSTSLGVAAIILFAC